jgi:hypothetical protein
MFCLAWRRRLDDVDTALKYQGIRPCSMVKVPLFKLLLAVRMVGVVSHRYVSYLKLGVQTGEQAVIRLGVRTGEQAVIRLGVQTGEQATIRLGIEIGE